MTDHDPHGIEMRMEPWSGGWLVALVAGIIGAILAKWIGNVSAGTALVIGIFVFLVFGVLLGMFWDSPSPNALGANAGGHHEDDGHGTAGHGHGGHEEEAHAVDGHSPAAPEPAVRVVASAPAAHSEAVAAPDGAGDDAGKPRGISAPRGGGADNLKEIEGIGPALEKRCNELGIYHFDQIAEWGEAEVAWMDDNLKGFKGRVTRDKWVAQAKLIVQEGVETFRVRAKTNDY